jgi:hypothetical protein
MNKLNQNNKYDKENRPNYVTIKNETRSLQVSPVQHSPSKRARVEYATSPVKGGPLTERNIDTPVQPPKRLCLQQCSEDEIRKNNLEFLNSLQQVSGVNNLYRDPTSGFEYIVIIIKKEELSLNKIYRNTGVRMPEHEILTMPKGGQVLLSPYIKGIKPSQYLKSATEEQRNYFFKEVRKCFAADVLFRNKPVLSGNLDESYVIDEKGIVLRLSTPFLNVSSDNVAYPIEIWEARDSFLNPQGHILWNTLDILTIANQIINLIKANDINFYGLPTDDKVIADKRLTNLLILANKTLSMSKDGWIPTYIDSLNKHMMFLKQAGCERGLPKWLRPDSHRGDASYELRGPNGDRFEGLRGRNSVVETILMPYVRNNGGNYQMIIDWMVGHESSGWSSMSQVLMYFLTIHRKAPSAGYFWKEGELMAKIDYEDRAKLEGEGDMLRGKKIIENSFIILHAFTQIVLDAPVSLIIT